MDLADKQSEFAQCVAKLIQYVYVCGYKCSLGEVYRTTDKPDDLHCRRLAIDLNIFSPQGKLLTEIRDYEKFGVYWEMLHQFNRWGGRLHKNPDGCHFEMMDK